MLKYAADVNRTIKGMGAIVENQGPLVQMFVHNWALSGVAGAALGLRLWRQWQKGQLTFWGGVQDAGVVISPLVGLFLLQKIAEEKHEQKSLARAAYRAGESYGSAPPRKDPPQGVPTSNGNALSAEGQRPMSSPQPEILGRLA